MTLSGDTPGTAPPAAAERRPRLLVVNDQPVSIQGLYQAFAADRQILMAKGGEQALALCIA